MCTKCTYYVARCCLDNQIEQYLSKVVGTVCFKTVLASFYIKDRNHKNSWHCDSGKIIQTSSSFQSLKALIVFFCHLVCLNTYFEGQSRGGFIFDPKVIRNFGF